MKYLIFAVLFIFMLPFIVQAENAEDIVIPGVIGPGPVADPIPVEPEVTEPEVTEPEVTVPKSKKKTKPELTQYAISAVPYPSATRGWTGYSWNRGRHGWWGDYHHASTAAEGYLSGRGRLYRGYGQYLESSGVFLNLYQDARHKAIINHRDAVHTWWQLKDEYRERFRREHPPWPDMKLHQLNMAQKRYDVLQLEKQMIQQGVLKPKPKSSFVFNGKIYASYEEFKNSPEWIFMRLGAAERQKKKTKVIQEPITKKKFEQVW
jgi:hypothetical protein